MDSTRRDIWYGQVRVPRRKGLLFVRLRTGTFLAFVRRDILVCIVSTYCANHTACRPTDKFQPQVTTSVGGDASPILPQATPSHILSPWLLSLREPMGNLQLGERPASRLYAHTWS